MVGEEEEYQVSSDGGERNLAESKRRTVRGRENVAEVAWAERYDHSCNGDKKARMERTPQNLLKAQTLPPASSQKGQHSLRDKNGADQNTEDWNR